MVVLIVFFVQKQAWVMCAPYFLLAKNLMYRLCNHFFLTKNAGIGTDLYFLFKNKRGLCVFLLFFACENLVYRLCNPLFLTKNAGIGNDLFFCSKTSVGYVCVPCCRIFVSLRVVAASFG